MQCNITYWVKGQQRHINKTDLPTGQPTADADGYISYEIQNLQTGVEYFVAVYGENQYSTDVLDGSYSSSRPSVASMYSKFIWLKIVKVPNYMEPF